jgi:hypothetical protein
LKPSGRRSAKLGEDKHRIRSKQAGKPGELPRCRWLSAVGI